MSELDDIVHLCRGIVGRVARRSWSPDVRGEVDELVALLRNAAGVDAGSSMSYGDLVLVGQLLGVVRVEKMCEGEARHCGELRLREGGFVLRVRQNLTSTQFLFTVAHELAHCLLFDVRAGFPARIVGRFANEERFADRVARALLAPEALVRRVELEARPFDGVEGVRRLLAWSGDLGIPVWHMFARCAESGLWGCRVAIRWEMDGAGVVRVAGFAKLMERCDFVPLRKSARDDANDPNGFVVELTGVGGIRVLDVVPGIGGLMGPWRAAGACIRVGHECAVLYRPVGDADCRDR